MTLRSVHALPYPTARPPREQHAEDALRALGKTAAAARDVESQVALPGMPDVSPYRALLASAVVAAIALPLLLLPNWYAADLGPEFTAEGVSGWDVGTGTQLLAWLGFAALVALAVSAGAIPASDGERIAATVAATALVAGAGIVWFRVAVVPEPAELFVREPGLWLAALVSTLGAAAGVGYAMVAKRTEIERLEAARAAV